MSLNWNHLNSEDLSALKGTTVSHILKGGYSGNEAVFFLTDAGVFMLGHSQDCCESVTLEDVVGDPRDVEGQVIAFAEERASQKDTRYGSETWTYYEFRTAQGDLNLRWFGKSNGYYSESVGFYSVDVSQVYGFNVDDPSTYLNLGTPLQSSD